MASNKQTSAIPIHAHLTGIEVVGDLEKKNSNTRPDHFVVVYVDDKEVEKSEKSGAPAPQWEWPEDRRFLFHPSSTIKVVIYRASRTHFPKLNHLVGQHISKVIELLENDPTIDLIMKDKAGSAIPTRIKIKLSVVSDLENDNFKTFMETVDADVSRLVGVAGTSIPPSISAIGKALQLTKKIMDNVAGTHPILKASWTILSSVYEAVQQTMVFDDNIRDLADRLQEMLGLAKDYPDLLVIKGTSNVIEETGRTSLKIASLIHEYTQSAFAKRTVKFTLSDDMKTRIAECQKSCDDLKQKFGARLAIDTNRQGARIEGDAKEIKGDVKEIKGDIRTTLRTIKDDQLAEKIFRWLSAPDSSKNYNEAREKHQEDTCSWFLSGTQFRDLQEKGGFLWIKGTAGSGKTILCSSIIEDITNLQKHNPSIAYAYFFFDGRDSQKDLQLHDKLIRSLIMQFMQFCLRRDGIPAILVELYGHGQQQPSTKSLEDALHLILDGLDSAYIIIDSLDECTERHKVLSWIRKITSLKMGNLRMVVTGRPEREIDDMLRPLDLCCVDVVKEVANVDIETYIDRELATDPKLNQWDQATQENIKTVLIKGAEGMYASFQHLAPRDIRAYNFLRFRWVALQLFELKRCSSLRAVKDQLAALPKDLNEAYDRILLKLDQRDVTDTKMFLCWFAFSTRPMTLKEIAETPVVDLDSESGPHCDDDHRYRNERDVLEKCSGLVIESEGLKSSDILVCFLNHKTGWAKLAHFSIKEYLASEYLCTGAASSFYLTAELAHSLIAQTCLAYLLQFDTFTLDEDVIKDKFALALYAAEYWIFHAQSGGIDKSESSSMLILALKLLIPESAPFNNWVQIWDLDEHHSLRKIGLELRPTDIAEPLYYTSLAGLQQVSQCLLEMVDVHAQGGVYGNALQAASYGGHEGIVRLLLEKVDVNVEGGYYGNALQAASSGGHEATVRLLLKKGADVNTQAGFLGNALQAASSEGHEMIVKLLLENGADVNVQKGLFGNPLQAASSIGHEAIVKLLLDKEVDVNAQGGLYDNALRAASSGGYRAIVKLLLDNKADVTLQGAYGNNALEAASSAGHEEIVNLLLEQGMNAQKGFYSRALQEACQTGHEMIVRLLLEKGADVNEQNGIHGNALSAAASGGHEAIVKLLLEKGAGMNASEGMNGCPLHAAAYKGHVAIVNLLLDKGMDMNAKGSFEGNALHEACSGGHEAIVNLLLEKGMDVNAQGGLYGNALQAASSNGHEVIVKLLLEKGANINAQKGYHGNALQAASSGGHGAIVKLLLQNKAHVNAQGGCAGSALQAAANSGKKSIVMLLLESGADVNAQGGFYGNALQAASERGNKSIVMLLLESGAEVNAQGGFYGNALQAASSRGHKTIVKLLLEKGMNVNVEGGYYYNALQAASYEGHEVVVKLLLEKEMNVHAQGGQYGNALQAASYGGHEAIVKLLLEKGMNVNVEGGHYGNALQAASAGGHEAIVKLLLGKGININLAGGEYGNALQAASYEGYEAIVKLLLEKGINVNVEGGKYGNALQAASVQYHEAIIKLLLDAGADMVFQG